MAFLVLGIGAKEPMTVDNAAPIETSFPGFAALMNGLGAEIAEATPPA
jgi:3-phosphoshikimate 1-carboxyvinyltransferase